MGLTNIPQSRSAVADLLRHARRTAGLKQVELASRLAVPQSFVSKYEAGERKLDILELRAICAALGVPLTAFIVELERELGEQA